ncbi:MAG: hypothetical protein ACE5IF_03525, partial [Candidatus Bathyarchaeia archaeon]
DAGLRSRRPGVQIPSGPPLSGRDNLAPVDIPLVGRGFAFPLLQGLYCFVQGMCAEHILSIV